MLPAVVTTRARHLTQDQPATLDCGECTCSKAAIDAQLETHCVVVAKDAKGQEVGACKGTRSCKKAGLTACSAPSPAIEVCDGDDNDCDGKTDESGCDDNNVCTADSCDPKLTIQGKDGCVHKPASGACDADGSACTVDDACAAGVCKPGKAAYNGVGPQHITLFAEPSISEQHHVQRRSSQHEGSDPNILQFVGATMGRRLDSMWSSHAFGEKV